MVYRVFVSSTSRDLAAHRQAVLAAIAGLDGFAVIAMENFGARAEAAIEFDDRKVRESDVLVGLLGLCYGSSPKDAPPSFTEREYDSAIGAGIDRLMLVSPDDFPVPGHLIEPDRQRRRQQAFRGRVTADLIVDAFVSPDALASAVTRALANWRAQREKVDTIVAELVAAKEHAARHEARASELERALEEGQREREALRAAVQALAAKAAAPDAPPRFERALALLPQGRTTEAEAIFSEIAARKAADGQRKQAEGAADLREAAEAARHLGALAYLDDTAKALDAYRSATELDPDDTWSWIHLGRLYQQAGNLAEAEQAFVSARAAAERTGDERDVAATDDGIGDVQRARGNLDAALLAFQDSLDIREKLAAQDPGNAGWQRDLSVSFERIGDVQTARGNLDAALQAFQDSLDIREKLAAQDPGNAGWQRDLSVSFNEIGDLQTARGNLDAALLAFQDSHAILEKLAAQDPGNAGWQRDLSVSFERIGDVQTARGNLDAALQAFQDSLDIREKLAAQDPGNAGWQRDLSVSFNKIGDLQTARGNLDAALLAFQDSHAIFEKLAAQDPGNAGWQRDLSVSFERIGDVQTARGNLDAALRAFQDSLQIAEKLAAQDPGNAGWQADLAISNERVGDMAARNGNSGDAITAFKRALAIYEALLARYPDNTQFRTFSVVPRWRLGMLKGADGLAHLKGALDILKELDAANRLDANRRGWIAQIEEEIAAHR